MKVLVGSLLALSLLGASGVLAQDVGAGAHVGPIGVGASVGVHHHRHCHWWRGHGRHRYCRRWD